jgi:serine/threonine-protein kinase
MTSPSDLDELLHQATAAASALLGPTGDGDEGWGSLELAAGSRLGGDRFVVREVIGRGGFGITYRAFDHRLERNVAVKELFPAPVLRRGRTVIAPTHAADGFAEARARFLREASVLARFSHPGIVRVYEVLEENGTAYLVMELLDGRSLATLQAERSGVPFAEDEALAIAARCGTALAVVHEDGVLHRDLNPSNVVMTDDGRVVIIDFGLAREFRADGASPMTRMVTPGYAPPEQYLGAGRFGPSSDVYGLAATLYRLLTGVAPVAAMDRQAGAALPPPARLNVWVGRLVSDAVMDGLELEAGHRPASMGDFLARLGLGTRPMATGGVRIGPPRRPPPAPAAPTPLPTLPRPAPIAGAGPVTRSPVKVSVPAPHPSYPGRPMTPPFPVAPPLAPVDPTVGSHRPSRPPSPPVKGRWKVALPVYVAVAAAGAAAPIVANLVLAVLLLPALATAGDIVTPRRGSRLPRPVFAAGRFVRNVAAMVLTAVPAAVVAAALVAAALLLDVSGIGRPVQDWLLRAGGAGVAILLVDGVLGNRDRYRANVIEDLARRRLIDASGRPTKWIWVPFGAAVGLSLVAVTLRPELWPLGG